MKSISRGWILIAALGLTAAGSPPPSWLQAAYVKSSNAEGGDTFGQSLAVGGDTVVVGAAGEDSGTGNPGDNGAPNSGAAYVFVPGANGWAQQAYLKASNPGANDGFGSSVAISGDTIVVGAPYEASAATGVNGNPADNSAQGAGAAYVFVRSGATWTQQAYLKASNTAASDWFGFSVAISGDTVLVGAIFEDSATGLQSDNSGADAGAVYVFKRTGTTWAQQAYLKPTTIGAGDWFGAGVAIDGDTIAVSAILEDSNATGVNGNAVNNSVMDAGAAYVFVRTGATWSQQAYLKASNPGLSDYFGTGLSISGDTVVVGAYGEDSSGTENDNSAGDAGAAYVFVRSGTAWSPQAYLKAPVPQGGAYFGYRTAIEGDTILVGAIHEDGNGNVSAGQGAVHLYSRVGSQWTWQGRLKASTLEDPQSGYGDWFGAGLGISGATIAVGAQLEDSAAQGINGDETDNSANASGAAYFFRQPQPPSTPESLAQVDAAGSVLGVGASVHSGFVAGATVKGWPGETLGLQVEVKAAGVAFDGTTGLHDSAAAVSGTTASVAIDGLAPGAYHWRARAWNASGSSGWIAYGGNAEPAGIDVAVVNAAPVAGLVAQRRADGSVLGAGQALFDFETIRFEATPVDPDADDVVLEVELRPLATPFRNEATLQSSLMPSGSTTSIAAVLSRDAYHWQSRTVDPIGGASAWISFGGNAESEADILVGPWGSEARPSCLGTAGEARGWMLLVMGVAGIAAGIRRR